MTSEPVSNEEIIQLSPYPYSMSSKPRFFSPSKVFIAAKSRERSIIQGRKFSLTSNTKTKSSFSRYPAIGEKWPPPAPKISRRLKLTMYRLLMSFELRRCSRNSSGVRSRKIVTFRLVCALATSASSSRVNPKRQKPVQHRPVPARTSLSVFAGSDNERNTFARLAGPHSDKFDCANS